MKIFAFFFTFLFAYTLNAQDIPVDIVDRINNTQYVFEGTVLETNPYHTTDGGQILTSNTLLVSKIFKGSDLECGTIELITWGGEIQGVVFDVSHTLELHPGDRGIFLANHSNMEQSQVDFYPETNSQVIDATFENQSFLKYWNNGLNWHVADPYHSYDSIRQVYDITEDIIGLEYIDCYNLDMSLPNLKPMNVDKDYTFPVYSQTEHNKIIDNMYARALNAQNAEGTAGGPNELTYELKNAKITGGTNKYFEFDIYLSHSDPGTYFFNGLVRLDYSTAAFGANIVANNKIQVTREAVIMDQTSYGDPIPGDISSTEVAIPLSAVVSPTNLYPLSSTPTKAAHVIIGPIVCNTGTSVDFTNVSVMEFMSMYESTSQGAFGLAYDAIHATGGVNVPDCKPVITSFTPTTISSGTGTELQIRGFQFGALRGSGTIIFESADFAGQIAVDNNSFISWSDTLLKLKMSFQQATISGQLSNVTPGSGKVTVRTDAGDLAVSQNDLDIYYAVSEILDGGTNKVPVLLGPDGQFGGKYTFYLDQDVANYNGGIMKAVVKKALADWSCITGINWELGKDTVTWRTDAARDGKNIIQFGNLSAAPVFQVALASANPIKCGNFYYNVETDIIINEDPSINWFVDTTSSGVPAGYHDFYHAILHELGHGHMQDHVNNSQAVMHYTVNSTPTFRAMNLYADQGTYDGGNFIMDRSINYPPSSACTLSTITTINSPLCGIFGITQYLDEDSEITFYPNPATTALNMELNLAGNRNMTVTVFDIDGSKVFEEVIDASTGYSTHPFDVTTLTSGVYLIFVSDNNSSDASSFKIIKQ